MKSVELHAVYVTVGEFELFRNSVGSIYDHVGGITVFTNYDCDWRGGPMRDDGVVDRVLDRTIDPERKIDLIVANETSEARARNRAMALALSATVSEDRCIAQHREDRARPDIDYFLIVDADEIWTKDDLDRLKTYAAQHNHAFLRVGAHRYFKRWNYRVAELEYLTALVRAGAKFNYLRNRRTSRVRVGLARLSFLPEGLRAWMRGFHQVPREVATFHHGSYVGPRDRIAQKLQSFGHSHELRPGWLSEVYDRWTPETTNFHPVIPERFPSTQELRASELPAEIRDGAWSNDYLMPD